MSVLCVGSVALDTIETPWGKAEEAVGGSAVYFSAAAGLFGPVSVVGVVGKDYPREKLNFLEDRGVDFTGLEVGDGTSFRWSGRYSYDLNTRDTLDTQLGVLETFDPKLHEDARNAKYVFLGNSEPQVQHKVLDQVNNPELVAADTMNLWIEHTRDDLVRLLGRIDMLMLNDEEARQLADEPNLNKAAEWIRKQGPDMVVVKKGEHGSTLYASDWVFFIPGYPLDEVYDPTGAGDSFAGGFFGYLNSVYPDRGREDLRRAMVFGAASASFTVEDFSVDRLARLRESEILARVMEFRNMTAFETDIDPDQLPKGMVAREGTSAG